MNAGLPNGWAMPKLKECVDVLDSQRVPINSDERANRMGNIPYYGATGQVGWIDNYLFDEELLLIGEDGAPFFDKSKPIAYIVNGKVWVNNHAHVLRAKHGITSNKFLKYFLNSFDFNGFVNGTTRLKLTQGAMNEIPVILPPITEQQRIVAKLEALLAKVDACRQRLEKIPTLLKRFRQSVLAAACSGRLTADWRHENPHSAVDFSQKIEETPEVPDSWGWRRLSDISQIKGGVTKGRKLSGKKTIKLPYLRVANVQDGFLNLSEIKEIECLPEDLEKYRLKEGDILFTEGGDRDKLGRGAVWRGEIPNCIHQNHIFRARVLSKEVTADFISLVSKSDFSKRYFFNNASQTVNLASINLSILSALPLPCPPIAEQNEISCRVEALFKIADRIEERYQRAKTQVDKLTQSILAKAFRGELVPQDPNDEPASILLERIKQQETSGNQSKNRGTKRKPSISPSLDGRGPGGG
jgi:type I restriction enzyme, S subunit